MAKVGEVKNEIVRVDNLMGGSSGELTVRTVYDDGRIV